VKVWLASGLLHSLAKQNQKYIKKPPLFGGFQNCLG